MRSPAGDTIIEKGKHTEILKLDKSTGKWISTYGMWSTNEQGTEAEKIAAEMKKRRP